ESTVEEIGNFAKQHLDQIMWNMLGKDERDEHTKFEFSVRSSPVHDVPGFYPTYLRVSSRREINDALIASAAFVRAHRARSPVAIIIQEMRLGTAFVVSTANPNPGKRELFGEFLKGRTGDNLMSAIVPGENIYRMATEAPEAFEQLKENLTRIEARKNNYPQEIEGVLDEKGRIWYLSSRDVGFTLVAEIQFLQDEVRAGRITQANILP